MVSNYHPHYQQLVLKNDENQPIGQLFCCQEVKKITTSWPQLATCKNINTMCVFVWVDKVSKWL